MRMLRGKRKDLNIILKQHGFAALIQTAFIERVNLTIRRGVAPLMRKTWSLAQNCAVLGHCHPRCLPTSCPPAKTPENKPELARSEV